MLSLENARILSHATRELLLAYYLTVPNYLSLIHAAVKYTGAYF